MGAQLPRAQQLQWFLSESNWDEREVQAVRLNLLREDPATAPNGRGGLVIDETGDRKDGHKTAHVSRQYLANLGKIDNGVVSVSSLWTDERVYYPLEVEPYTPESSFAKGKHDPQFHTKLKLALELVKQAIGERLPFRAMVADSFYKERAIVASTDPQTHPDLSTWYLVTNLPAPTEHPGSQLLFSPASLEEVIRLYGLRMWAEQGYKPVKHALGWSQYQVRSDKAIRRHWQLVCCAFSFCWYHASHASSSTTDEPLKPVESEVLSEKDVSAQGAGTGEKISESKGMRPQMSWPMALRAVRAWLEPWIMLRRYWSGWSSLLPPPAIQRLLQWLECGRAIALYNSS